MTTDILDMEPQALAAEIRARFDSLKIAMDAANDRSGMRSELWLRPEFNSGTMVTISPDGMELLDVRTTVML